MQYYAHKTDEGRKQTVKEHLDNVAELAEKFSVEPLKSLAYAAGEAHDIGKYSQTFQERLNGKNVKFEHSSCGAIEYSKIASDNKEKVVAAMLEYCIAGHHTGLPDGGSAADSAYDDVTLHSRLGRSEQYVGDSDYSAYRSEIQLSIPQADFLLKELKAANNKNEIIERYAFFTRYLFSCLTDADFLDTEKFCSPDIDRETHSDFDSAEKALVHRFGRFKADTPLKKARGRLQEQAYQNSHSCGNISVLNMPTGSGKTLCSLKIALQKLLAAGSNKKRIIYVIPYTSIIEQTAEQFEQIIGKHVDILQHHSNYCFDDKTNEPTTAAKLKKAAENWDAPLVITTSVQFFQSLYHYKGSGLRKLHNIGDSIIIFDEIHLLPVNMLQPCLRGIGYITKYLNSEAIFLSATMPDYSNIFDRYLPECSINDLMTDKSDFKYFEKCRYINLGKTDYENVIEKSSAYTSSLIIVNTRKAAREVYREISGKKYHLSTYMTPFDRSETIAAIRNDLKSGEKITVVSTSLVEAGVDLDFETVFRQLAGLDSILQSGGRCNREGRREVGDVYVFETDGSMSGDLKIRANITESLLCEFDNIASTECIETYYNRLFDFYKDRIEQNSIAKDCKGIDNIPFRKYAEDFDFIRDDTVGVVIDNCKESAELVNKLKYGDHSVKRKLQRYTVALKRHTEFEKAFSIGIVDDFGTGVYILTNPSYYNKETGLDLDMTQDIII